MLQTVVPLLHVPDVRSTALWYIRIGFELHRIREQNGTMSWALLTYENSELMIDSFGKPSDAPRRDLDLYIYTRDVQRRRNSLPPQVEIIEDLHNTDYGMCELILRDPNGFWITFGQALWK